MITGPQPGATADLSGEKTIFDFFRLFFSMELFALLVLETNAYAARCLLLRPDGKWVPTNIDEITAWLGIRLYMSIFHLPDMRMYWSEDHLFGNNPMSHVMTRDRFENISRYFHASNTTQNPARGQPGHDRICHVRPLITMIVDKCRTLYNPHINTSVDEAMVAFRGRLGFRQYIPSKPTKYGIKVWIRADPVNGYANDFQVYTGKVEGRAEIGLCSRVVLDLVQGLDHKGHIVNTDNFFSSPALSNALLLRGIYSRGTVRPNRHDFPKAMLTGINLRGDYKVVQKGPLLAIAWMDRKPVHFVSNADNPINLRSNVQRRQRDGSIVHFPCPTTVVHYNENMNGVDVADQLRTKYPTSRKSNKWWHSLFWFLFDLCIVNSFIIRKESPNHQELTRTGAVKPFSMLDFRKCLIKSLIGNYREGRKRTLPPNVNEAGIAHWPRKTAKAGRCIWCRQNGRRSAPKSECTGCDRHLCLECFIPHHENLNT